MRKTYKKIISLCAVLIFALAWIPTTVFADPFSSLAIGGIGGISGAGLFSSMTAASGISIGYSSGTSVDQTEALWSSLNPDHVYFSGEKGQVTEIDPVTELPTVYDYISVDISDWLEAQNDFIDEFVSNYQIVDNSNGTFVIPKQYNGYYFNRNIGSVVVGETLGTYQKNTTIQYSDLRLVFSSININVYKGQSLLTTLTYNNSYTGYDVCLGVAPQPSSTPITWYACNFPNSTVNGTGRTDSNCSVASSGTWTSGTVNTGVFDGYTAAQVKIPASSWNPSDPVNWSVQEFLEELSQKWSSGTQSDIVIEDDNPEPPPVPVPTTPLGDIPTDEWYDLFGLPVLEGQEEIHKDLQDFNESVSEGLDDIGEQLDDAADSLESIDTNIQTGNGLLGDLKSLGQNILSTLNSILSGVTDLVQEIVLSTETFIAGLLNSIMGGLGGWLSTMRDAFSIWHYVVEWVGSISTVFSWFWSVAGSTSYYIQLPIYASLAGAVVLAFYKRFGK